MAHEALHGGAGWKSTLVLAWGTLGVIYGDIGTSPLYVYASVLTDGTPSEVDVMGVMSLIFYTLTLLALIKYVLVVLRADDNGEGGTFALYSLLCRAMGVTPMGQQLGEADKQLSRYSKVPAAPGAVNPAEHTAGAAIAHQTTASSQPAAGARGLNAAIKRSLATSHAAQVVLMVVVVIATSMVVGDGILTPAISVLSAVTGLKAADGVSISQDAVLGITAAILILLFSSQRFGTAWVGGTFAPIVIVWLGLNAGVGIYNLATSGGAIFKALNPAEIVWFFQREGKAGWKMLGGVMLCITGCEAMFADLGHFTRRAVSMSFVGYVYPCLVLTYLGQGAYLLVNPDQVSNLFWACLPRPVFWPMFVAALLASIVASQALISGTFSIIRQAIMLGMLPKMNIIHTGKKVEGQIYLPMVNWTLMVLCVAVTCGFGDTTLLGEAYGVAVMSVIVVTTLLITLVMLIVWDLHPAWAALWLLVYLPLECAFLSATLVKVVSGGWVALVVAAVVSSINIIWWWGCRVKAMGLRDKQVPLWKLLVQRPAAPGPRDPLLAPLLSGRVRGQSGISNINEPTWDLVTVKGERLQQMPGLGLYYTETSSALPATFVHAVHAMPAVFQSMVLLTVKMVPIPHVDLPERFLVKTEPAFEGVFRVIVRYGYQDHVSHGPVFGQQLVLVLVQHLLDAAGIGGAGAAELLMAALPSATSTLDSLVKAVTLLPEEAEAAAKLAADGPDMLPASVVAASEAAVVAKVALRRGSMASAPADGSTRTNNSGDTPFIATAPDSPTAPVAAAGGEPALARPSRRALGLQSSNAASSSNHHATSPAAEGGFPSAAGGRWYLSDLASIKSPPGTPALATGSARLPAATELVTRSRQGSANDPELGLGRVNTTSTPPPVGPLSSGDIQAELQRLSTQEVVWELTAKQLAALKMAAGVVRAYRTRLVHLLGKTNLSVAPTTRNPLKTVVLGQVWTFLATNQHDVSAAWGIPAPAVLELGMDLEVS